MANKAPHTTSQSATERLEASRNVKADAIARELAWATIVVRMGVWPSWKSKPRIPQPAFPWLLNIDTPAGRIVYRVSKEEHEQLFGDLPEYPNDGVACTVGDKLSRLLHLATEGW